MSIVVDLTAEIAPINPFDFFIEPYAAQWPFTFPPDLNDDLVAFVTPEPAGPRLTELLRSIPRAPRSTINVLIDLNRQIQGMVRYLIRMAPGVQTPEETLAAGAGSCRDSAWLMVQLLRHLGLPARFVSGYLIQLRPEIVAPDSPERDSASLHAWAEAYLPGAGWIGLDVTSGLLCGEGHIPLAATPHYRSATPIAGTVEPCNVTFAFDMNVTRLGRRQEQSQSGGG